MYCLTITFCSVLVGTDDLKRCFSLWFSFLSHKSVRVDTDVGNSFLLRQVKTGHVPLLLHCPKMHKMDKYLERNDNKLIL